MVVNDYFYLHHLLGEWSKMLLTTIHYEGEILRLPSARLLIAYGKTEKRKEPLAEHPMYFGQRLLYNCNAFLKLLYCPDLLNFYFRGHHSEPGFGSHKAENLFPARPVSYTQEYHLWH